jgi:hypothetical protein
LRLSNVVCFERVVGRALESLARLESYAAFKLATTAVGAQRGAV